MSHAISKAAVTSTIPVRNTTTKNDKLISPIIQAYTLLFNPLSKKGEHRNVLAGTSTENDADSFFKNDFKVTE